MIQIEYYEGPSTGLKVAAELWLLGSYYIFFTNLKTTPTTFEDKSDVCSDICTYLPLKLNCGSKFHGTLRPILTLGEPSPFAFCKPPM